MRQYVPALSLKHAAIERLGLISREGIDRLRTLGPCRF